MDRQLSKTAIVLGLLFLIALGVYCASDSTFRALITGACHVTKSSPTPIGLHNVVAGVCRIQGNPVIAIEFGESDAYDDVLRHLKAYPQLQRLSLMQMGGLTDRGMDHVANLPNLTELRVTWMPNIGSDGLARIKGLIQLQVLDLSYTQVDDLGVQHLKEMKQLKELVLTGTKVTQAGLNELRKELPLTKVVPTN